MSLEKAVSLIRGEKGSEVKLTILRQGLDAPLTIKIVRDVINIPTLEIEVKPSGDTLAGGSGGEPEPGNIRDGVFIIRLFNFNAGAPEQFRSALREFIASGSDKLIVDLRNNPGGFLEAAIEVASWFLPAGEVIVKEELAGGVAGREYVSKGYNAVGDNVQIAILINGGSASASEIVAGALQEHNRAVLVGEQSFGKGSVQELIEITPDTALKLTIARWLTPLGNSISEGGLTPDVVVELSDEDIEAERDSQMEKAIEILNQ
jgi:carboxyl-terminal processing protease